MNVSDLAVKYEEFKKSRIKHSEIQITDNNEILLSGCRRIVEYDENIIKLELSSTGIFIVGTELKARNFSSDGIIISGRLHSIEFVLKEEL